MQTTIALSPCDTLIGKLREKGYRQLSMTSKGFGSGNLKYTDPRELNMLKAYRFEDVINPDHSSSVYILQDKEGNRGYSVDMSEDYENNEYNLYHWFISKIPNANS